MSLTHTVFHRIPLTAAVVFAFASHAQAQSLVEMFDAARGYDAGFISAKAQFEANLARANQSLGGILPNIAVSVNGYVLADRGTWLNFKNRGDLAVLVEGDQRLFNQYGVMAVSAQKHPHLKAADAQKFVDWVISPAGQQAIASYRIGGEQLFFPNAGSGK